FLADNVTELERAFNSIFTRIETDVATFTSPAASVNSLNRLQNRNILYFTMFEPSPMGEPRWDGNLKAYKVGRETNADDLTILDANNVEAISDDGTFQESARSIWSQTTDGGVVTEGGFISRLGLNRKVYTDVAGSNLSAPENRVIESNTTITAAQVGVATPPGPDGAAEAEERRQMLLRMASGLDEDGQPLRTIGDPLHTRPLILTYAGGSEELAIFMSTNDGFLHRIDPTPIEGDLTSDLEEWAYIPSELLPNLDTIERNPPTLPSFAQKLYGLDGPLTAFIEGDTNSIVDPSERVYVYSAMRRGGTSYYALDLGVGGDQPPKLAFKISRGGEFSRLGQTWSAAEHARMKIGDTERNVLIFGGGYDPVHDDDGGYVPSTMGSAVYIVDAKTGQQLWRASSEADADLTLTDMVYPIPSDITVLDINRDGLADRMYVGDTGGQVWRFDNLDGELSGAVFANLGSDASQGDERRFYNAPSVARIITRTGSFLTISMGSGWRAHPLATENNDRFYVLKDVNVFTPQLDGSGNPLYPDPLTNDDLFEIELGVAPDSSELASSGGWYLPLASGEKNLSSALTADNRVFFTTYLPESGPLSCQPTSAIGSGRLYALDIFTGFPALVNGDGSDPDVDTGPLFEELQSGGIPPEPQLVFVEPPCVENCDGPEDERIYATVGGTCVNPGSEVRLQVGLSGLPANICTAPVQTYWTEAEENLEEL
ncbi:MAG: PilC/PilY family type IV pilus protein, partial [Pseudomonadota bacterium]